MRKVQKVIQEMQIFLDGADQSCSPKFRALAAEYNSLCSQVKNDLERCRQKIASGALHDAREMNFHAEPPFTERCRKLQFPGLKQWRELCKLYDVPQPPDFDSELNRTLEETAVNDSYVMSGPDNGMSARSYDELLEEWRSKARTGSLDEKIRILRLLAISDDSSSAWRKNLEQVEKSWVTEKLMQAQNCVEERNAPELYRLYRELTSPELLHPVSRTQLEPFRKIVQKYKEKLDREKLTQLLQQIAEAYSGEDLEKLRLALEQYRDLTGSMEIQPTELESRQIKEAKAFLDDRTQILEKERLGQEMQNQLAFLLDQQADFHKISELYQQIQRTEIPIDPMLNSQYRNLEERVRLADHRNYVRRTLIAVLTIIMVAAAGLCTLFFIQRHSEIRQNCATMEDLLAKRAPEQLIKFHSELVKKKPYLQKEAQITTYRQKAEQLRTKMQEEAEKQQKELAGKRKEFQLLINRIQTELTEEKAESKEIALLFQEADQLRDFGTPDQKDTLIQAKQKWENLRDAAQLRRDRNFTQKANELSAQFNKFRKYENPKGFEREDTDALEQELRKVKTETAQFLSGSARISKNVFNSEKIDLTERKKQAEDILKDLIVYQKNFRNLTSPKTIEEYLDGLKNAPPSLHEQYRAAKQQVQDIVALIRIHAIANPAEQADKVRATAGLLGNAYLNDLKYALPKPGILTEIQQKNNSTINQIDRDWNLMEIRLQSQNVPYFFYVRQPGDAIPERSGGNLGGTFVCVRFNDVQLKDGSRTILLKARPQKNSRYLLMPNEKYDFADLPQSFDGITTGDLNRMQKQLKPALHYTKMKTILDALNQEKDVTPLEERLLSAIQDVASDSKLNRVARVEMIQLLLAVFKEISPLNQNLALLLPAADPDVSGCWKIPGFDLTEKGTRILRTCDPAALNDQIRKIQKIKRLYEEIMAHPPMPAGIVKRDEKTGTQKLHFFQGFDASRGPFYLLTDEKWQLLDPLHFNSNGSSGEHADGTVFFQYGSPDLHGKYAAIRKLLTADELTQIRMPDPILNGGQAHAGQK